MTNKSEFTIGDRVEIAPHYDAWMKGDKYGRVDSIEFWSVLSHCRAHWVMMDKSLDRFYFPVDDLTRIDDFTWKEEEMNTDNMILVGYIIEERLTPLGDVKYAWRVEDHERALAKLGRFSRANREKCYSIVPDYDEIAMYRWTIMFDDHSVSTYLGAHYNDAIANVLPELRGQIISVVRGD